MDGRMNKKYFCQALLAAIIVNLVIGVNSAWSIFEAALVTERAWTHVQASLPSTVYSFFYSIGFIIAGITQDHLGSKRTCRIASLMALIGYTGAAFSYSVWVFALFYGMFTGLMVAFGYSAALPAPMKWLPEKERGKYSGFTICAFALTASYMAPLAGMMIPRLGFRNTLLLFGAGVSAILLAASFFLHVPPDSAENKRSVHKEQPASAVILSFRFAAIFSSYFASTFAFTVLATHMINIANVQSGAEAAFYLITVFSVSNCVSRLIGGIASDIIPIPVILCFICLLDGTTMLAFERFCSVPLLVCGCIIVGISYGTTMAVTPSIMSSLFGMDHFGRNFGFVSNAAGIAGVMASFIAGMSIDRTGSYLPVYIITACFLLLSALLQIRLFVSLKH